MGAASATAGCDLLRAPERALFVPERAGCAAEVESPGFLRVLILAEYRPFGPLDEPLLAFADAVPLTKLIFMPVRDRVPSTQESVLPDDREV